MSNKNKKKGQKVDPAVMAAIITLIGTLVTLLVTYEPIKNWWNTRLNSTPTLIPTVSATDASLVVPSETPARESNFTPTPGITETIAPSPAIISTFTDVPDIGVMTAQIASNYYDGRAPFTATFRAGTSFVIYPDGRVETCEFAHVCSYTWDVREKNGSTIYGPEAGGKEFAYNFTKRGEFIVVVYVCRGQACSFTAANVTAR
ncbi:MAG: hypothetical protein DCC59_00540 [Chloroflexi bacterium]|nr:hypothetical protein [Anaerolineales bacterium]MDL1919567.1 hypothetical protein [Chloroflexi bacterium CFX5]NUQ58248.1 hypothetical protein [Anaerolineales bacterium]RIK55478.1 MAG: hypothetical protein DCC59_00540 [Chloroflexota bacterium]